MRAKIRSKKIPNPLVLGLTITMMLPLLLPIHVATAAAAITFPLRAHVRRKTFSFFTLQIRSFSFSIFFFLYKLLRHRDIQVSLCARLLWSRRVTPTPFTTLVMCNLQVASMSHLYKSSRQRRSNKRDETLVV